MVAALAAEVPIHCPQRLKPRSLQLFYGTAKAVPLSKTELLWRFGAG